MASGHITRKKKIIIGSSLIAVLGIIMVLVWFFVIQKSDNTTKQSIIEDRVKEYDSIIENSTDQAEKNQAYNKKATLYQYEVNDPIKSAETLDQLARSTNTHGDYASAGHAWRAAGDSSSALRNFELARESLLKDSSINGYDSLLAAYELQIKELKEMR